MKKRILAMLIAVSMIVTLVSSATATTLPRCSNCGNRSECVVVSFEDKDICLNISVALAALRYHVGLETTNDVALYRDSDLWRLLMSLVPNTNFTESRSRIGEAAYKVLFILNGTSNCAEICNCDYCNDCQKLVVSEDYLRGNFISEFPEYGCSVYSILCLCDVYVCGGCRSLVECTGCFELGHVLGATTDAISIADALEILRYTVGLPSIIDECDIAKLAALIVSEETPGIADALQILRYLVDLPSALD